MLKALELVGFKSFADKTRFEFPQGITAVVGPNGSGKSNIVDAIKWVLGEQSVKSLRGKEMADVIFNGSGSRSGLNSAETTLTFENSRGMLPIDTPEVHITRRVYRSGEGEYLINRQPSRLRDIRELFSGTGVATEAYSVIEQGKVDVLLQASPKDRRAIFEEAAGISRFRAKKVESMRRLERVEQNLLRLSDIVEEVESRLRSVRLQAGKARRYREHVQRLQELRTQVGLADWRTLGEKLAGIEAEIQTLSDKRDATAADAEAREAEALQLETVLGDVTEVIRAIEARIAENRERIATCESTISHERHRWADLEEETSRHRRQLAAMSTRAGDLQQQLSETLDAVTAARQGRDQLSRQLATDEQVLAQFTHELATLKQQEGALRTAGMEQLQATTALAAEVRALESQIEQTTAACQRDRQEIDQLHQRRQDENAQLQQLRQQQQQCRDAVEEHAAALSCANDQLEENRKEHSTQSAELNKLRRRHAGASERAALLEELERRREGVGAGVKEILQRAQRSDAGPLRCVRGLVADLFKADVEHAPLIDVALGEKVQHLLVDFDPELLQLLERESCQLPGPVGFVSLDALGLADSSDEIDLEGQAGVLGRADRFVQTAAVYSPLLQRLLGRTWIVQRLSHAIALSETTGRGLSFVTLAGEMVSADGTLLVGPRQTTVGLISRRSQLRALKDQIAEWDAAIGQTTAATAELERQIAANQQQAKALAAEHQQAVDALAEQRLRVKDAEGSLTQVLQQITALENGLAAAAAKLEEATAVQQQVRGRYEGSRARQAELEFQANQHAQCVAEVEAHRSQWESKTTTAKVELAKSDERLGNLQMRQRQFEQDQQERQRSISEVRTQLQQCQQRAGQSRWNILQRESEVAELYLRKEALSAEALAQIERRESQRIERTGLVGQAQRIRVTLRKLEERLHALDLAANEVRLERGALADRLRDDYGIELAELEHEPSPEEQHQREAVESEIADLRRKINNIGNVNLDALDELEAMESRYQTLSSQYDDLAKAKRLLEQIIGKINADSRRLFSETLETVRGHFQTLFRKLFGGGQADIVLEQGVDILDSGIEIVARPPGKEPRSISLLSGGEKTLTCVALLLAIFQYRPSPFCVLDEVDAALDEANIERFIGVLREFLAWTQFIVVTHSKKTMTCATTLYGVTMQESGVSKRVSVRFEDVSDDGEIRLPDQAATGASGKADHDEQSDETQAA